MYFEFYLDDLEIEEPQGFADIVLNMNRDNTWHGIFFEASTTDLAFYGIAASYLKAKKETQGLKSEVTFKALQSCGVYEEPEIIYEGRLDFGKYTESCGNICLVKIPVEQVGCLMTFRNRYDQKVDLDSAVALDKLTALANYSQLGQTMTMPAIALDASVEGYVESAGYNQAIDVTLLAGISGAVVYLRPDYIDERYNSINTGQLTGVNNCDTNNSVVVQCTGPITPQLLLEDNIKCFDGTFAYNSRLKGTIEFGSNINITTIKQVLLKWDGAGTIYTDADLIVESTIHTGPTSGPFSIDYDNTVSGTTALENEEGFYAMLELTIAVSSGDSVIDNTFHQETYINIHAQKLCPDTTVQYYMVHEALSRVTESITSNCLKVKSDYYGRIDSQPYAASVDGCGSLRFVTSGLKIRRANNPAFFTNIKDLFDGLRAIDNIGMGIEEIPNVTWYRWLRIEPVEYFYQDQELLSLPFIPGVEISVQEQLHYSLIKAGYQKWEVEEINGLEEPNSNREYRTSLTTVNNTLDITSKLVGGSYATEVTRQQSFADTGAADTTYDNETFIICVERQAYSFTIEQDNIDNSVNIFSPETLYNWRIRPFSNLMRWFKSIANSYPNISDSSNKLFFSSGTGNFIAEGELNSATCKLENGAKAENRDLSALDFANATDATPLWKPEFAEFKYPLSVAEYRTLKANPYGYISFQCGTGEWRKGYIQNIRYRLNKGEAEFILKLKYE